MMQKFTRVTGVAAPLMQVNIDTDQITPGRVLMKVAKSGFGEGLFADWRYLADGSPNPEFILNRSPFDRAAFLVAGANFGCGSSREFAVWALRDFGIRAVIAPSFGAIFTSNCFMNGVAPIALPERDVEEIAAELSAGAVEMIVDLEAEEVIAPSGRSHAIHLPALQRERLLEGLDAIDATLKRAVLIEAYQASQAARRPWVFAPGGDVR